MDQRRWRWAEYVAVAHVARLIERRTALPPQLKVKPAALLAAASFSTNGRLVRHVDICWVDRTHQVQYGDRVLVGRSAVWRIIERVVGLIEQESLGAVGEAVARAILNLRRVEHLTERQSATESRC